MFLAIGCSNVARGAAPGTAGKGGGVSNSGVGPTARCGGGGGGNSVCVCVGGGQQWGCHRPLRIALHAISISLPNSLR